MHLEGWVIIGVLSKKKKMGGKEVPAWFSWWSIPLFDLGVMILSPTWDVVYLKNKIKQTKENEENVIDI